MENQKQTQKNKISELIESSLESIRSIVDSGTVIGAPINTPQGTTIIPVSKVSMGFAGGGNDFTGKTGGDGKNSFSGGGGTGITVTPTAFLIVSAEGEIELLNVANPTNLGGTVGSAVDNLVDKAPDLLDKLKGILGSKKKKKGAAETATDVAADAMGAAAGADKA
ncbi:MAG: sporulation protein YtfJ [Clostridia bacterium]|nr:sporulation protein YtfJ [Clostridia bacterium]